MNDIILNKIYSEAITRARGIKQSLEEQQVRLWKVSLICENGFIKKPKGLFRKKCPKCGSNLVRKYPYNFIWRVCSKCDYEWAKAPETSEGD